MIIPFVGETPTGGESTKFLPRSSRDFLKHFLKTQYFTIKQLSVDHLPVNLSSEHQPRSKHQPRSEHQPSSEHQPYSVPQPWSRTRSSYGHSSRPRSFYSRRSYKARSRVEQNYRRLHFSPSNQGSFTPTDRQATNKTPLPEGVRREESGPGDRRGHKGSSLLKFSAYFSNFSQLGAVTTKRCPRGPQGKRSIPQSDLYSPKDGTRKRVWQKIYTQPQSK